MALQKKQRLDFIIRDFETINLAKHEERLQTIAEKILKHHPKATMQFQVTEQYRNMKEVLDKSSAGYRVCKRSL